MADFATFAAVEVRCRAAMEAGTWIVAYATRLYDGTLCARAIRPMSAAHPAYGEWLIFTDDAAA